MSPVQSSYHALNSTEIPFQHEPSYLQLQRMLSRYQSFILLVQPSNAETYVPSYDLTPLQRQIQAELYCPLPYHRTKWLHNIESARNLLLTLERQAQGIKIARAKKEALKDLAEKRQIIKRLRNRVEEIAREVESLGERAWDLRRSEDEELLGERADEVLRRMGRGLDSGAPAQKSEADALHEGKPVTDISQQYEVNGYTEDQDRDVLFDSSVRRRQNQSGQGTEPPSTTEKGTISGFSNLAQTEKSLLKHSHEHEDLTSALVSMAAQLKQQSRAFQFSLSQDDNILNRAIEGLDKNISGMEMASKNMAFLRRMSEEQGWFGRLKLYGIIFGMWTLAVLLVFVGPKLRF